MRFLLLSATVLLAGCHAAPKAEPGSHTVRGMNDLVRLERCELDALYRQCEVGAPPCGKLDGRAIINAGSAMTVPTSRIVGLLWWGKFIDGDTMRNRVLGLRIVPARIYLGESWVDGKPALIMDYAGTTKLFADFRDEVREVSPGLYLGVTHQRTSAGPEFKTFFTLDQRKK